MGLLFYVFSTCNSKYEAADIINQLLEPLRFPGTASYNTNDF